MAFLKLVVQSTLVLLAAVPAVRVDAQTHLQWQLWKINADGTALAPFANTPGYSCGSPDWSPNGKFVAYDTWPIEKTWSDAQVAVVPADGSKPPRLLGPGAMPSWSPDGTQLVCHTYDNPQTIVVMKADGTGRETILNHWGSPRWSPRGNFIASIHNGRIALFDLATGKERIVVFDGQYTLRQGFAISPDGLHFCFGDANMGVSVATLDERSMQASVRQLVNSGTANNMSWSPDGKRFVFAWHRPDDGPIQLFIIDVASDNKPVPLKGQDRARSNTNPDWSPDGKTIVFSSQFPP